MSKPWEHLAPAERRALWHAKDPQVPQGWLPPGIKPWEDIPHNKRCRLYREGDPRVPQGWMPVRQNWDALSATRKRALWMANDPRVPLGWEPEPCGRTVGFRQYHYPESIAIELTPAMLEIPEKMLWDLLELQWDAELISPAYVIFRIKGQNLGKIPNPRVKSPKSTTTQRAKALA